MGSGSKEKAIHEDRIDQKSIFQRFKEYRQGKDFHNDKKGFIASGKKLIIDIFRFLIIVGISYVILAPVIGIVVNSFFSDADAYSPMVYMIPQDPTTKRYDLVLERLNYWVTCSKTLLYSASLMLIQVVVCSMVGYGFARFNFPGKNILVACVVVMIVIPAHTIMLPLH